MKYIKPGFLGTEILFPMAWGNTEQPQNQLNYLLSHNRRLFLSWFLHATMHKTGIMAVESENLDNW
jgi:hypothetical protein